MSRPSKGFWRGFWSRIWGWALLLLLCLPVAAGAECIEVPPVTVRKVEGVVMAHPSLKDKEAEGDLLPGTLVILLRKTATGWTEAATALSDAAGRFSLPAVPPGRYKLVGEQEGLTTVKGELRVRRWTLPFRGTLILWMDRDLFEGCGGLELRRGRVDG